MDYKQSYELWKTALQGTEYEAGLAALAQDEAALSDSFYREMEFGTAGMRGIIGLGTNRMNIFTVRRATQALAMLLKDSGKEERGVAIAYDTRQNSELFAQETAGILLKNGIKVFMYQTPHSVPQLSFTILELGCAAGVVITASHNPPAYNGYKVYGEDGGQLSVAHSNIITKYINEIDDMFNLRGVPVNEASRLFIPIGHDLDEIYYKKVEDLCLHKDIMQQQSDNLNIVYTPLFGTGLVPVRRVLTDLGIKKLHIVPEQKNPDPAFPGLKAPNPEERESFDLAVALANKVDANIILATDPDSDRLGVAVRNFENEFTILTGNEIGCLMMEYVLSQKKETFGGGEFVIKSIVTTDMVDKIAAHYGVELKSVYTGFKYIAEQIKLSEQAGKGEFIFGFEESFGYLRGPFVRDKDAVQGAMTIAEAACYYASKYKTLYEAVLALYEKYGWYKELVVSKVLYGQEGVLKIKNAVETLRSNVPSHIGDFKVLAVRDYLHNTRRDIQSGKTTSLSLTERSNVLYLELENGRFIIRPSGTEPKLKSYLTAFSGDKDEAALLLTSLRESAENLIEKLTE